MSVLCMLLKSSCVAAAVLSGPATVQDGDTIYVQHRAVRLAGIDAEELHEPNGIRAKLALRALIGGADVTCEVSGDPSYSRSVATCFVNGVNLNASMVATGFALDCARYSGGKYRKDEAPGARARLRQKPYC